MTGSSPADPSRPARRGALKALGAVAILAAAWTAYSNSFQVPFQFDDVLTIAANPTIHHWATVFSPPRGTTAGGRPVLNASFALNWALGGYDLRGFHAVNLLIHVLGGLLLWGIVTRTLRAAGRTGGWADMLGFCTAILWAVHPLQTESVTYLSQRAESLMGLFYLLTLYGFIRYAHCAPVSGAGGANPAAESGHGLGSRRAAAAGGWAAVSVLACLLGMATKEVMVSAPVIVLLYDRTFSAGSFTSAWRRRRPFYLALAATWLPLVWLVASLGGNRAGSTGFGAGVSWGDYELTQFPAICHYLGLTFWPNPLVFEYGPVPREGAFGIAVQILLVASLLLLTAVGLARRSPWGFLGALFFAVLAPTSLVPGAIQRIAEHRMYLASAPVICLAVLGADSALARLGLRLGRAVFVVVAAAVACVLVFATASRNRDYRTPLSLWADTVAKRPDHALAHYNLANELSKSPAGAAEALVQYGEALKLSPGLPPAHFNLAVLLESMPGREAEAIDHYRQALEGDPDYVEAHNNLAAALVRAGRLNEAIVHLEQACRLEPGSGAICGNLGSTYFMAGRYGEAVDSYRRAVQIDPNDVSTIRRLGLALQKLGRESEAQDCFVRAARIEATGATDRR